MAGIKVVTDSVSDIPSDLLARFNIDVVPLDVRLGTEGPKELIGITPEEFWRRVRATAAFAEDLGALAWCVRTSLPSRS